MTRRRWEEDEQYDGAYVIDGWRGIAWNIMGWELDYDEYGESDRTGKLIAVMIGDDRPHVVDPEDVHKIDDLAYCACCGQVGCHADGREREEVRS